MSNGGPTTLGEFEQLVMITIIRVGSNAYGATVFREITERTKRSVTDAAVYACISRLCTKGFVSWYQVGSDERKRHLRVEQPGYNKLVLAMAHQKSMILGSAMEQLVNDIDSKVVELLA